MKVGRYFGEDEMPLICRANLDERLQKVVAVVVLHEFDHSWTDFVYECLDLLEFTRL